MRRHPQGVLAAVGVAATALLNVLHGGWGWWAAGAVVLLCAVGTAVMAYRADPPWSARLVDQAVYTGAKIKDGVTTKTRISAPTPNSRPPASSDADVLGRGVVLSRDFIGGQGIDGDEPRHE
jgi:hypothetical protein